MAKVLFSARSNIVWGGEAAFDPYYEALINELKKNGHDLLIIRTNNLVYTTNLSIIDYSIVSDLTDEIKKFNPDIIITSNNSMPSAVYELTNCPIYMLSADSPSYFEGNELIKKHIERYTFLHFGWESIFKKQCEELYGAKPEQNFDITYHSTISSANLNKKYPISYLGTIGWGNIMMHQLCALKDNNEMEQFLLELEKKELSYDKLDLPLIAALNSNMRIKTLDALCNLDLTVFGWSENFFQVAPYSLELAKCFNFDKVITSTSTEKMLNSSTISITLPNLQAVRGLSWRVADIMASSACVISPPKEDLKLISPYVEIPTYTSPAEARELCVQLLKDDIWRSEIVAGSQKAINENHRFSHLLQKIEEISSIKLINKNCKASQKSIVISESIYKKQYTIEKRKKKKKFLREASKVLPYFIAKKIIKKL